MQSWRAPWTRRPWQTSLNPITSVSISANGRKSGSSVEKFQHDTTGGLGREPQEIRAALLRGRTWLLRAYIIGRGESCLRPTSARAQITKSRRAWRASIDYVAGWRLHWIVIAKCGGIRPFELQVATGQVVANWVIISGRC
jgi:hypothetical protein